MPNVSINITERKREFINGQNGNKLTKLKGGKEIKDSFVEEDTGNSRPEESQREKTADEKLSDISVKLTPEEQEEFKRLTTKLNA